MNDVSYSVTRDSPWMDPKGKETNLVVGGVLEEEDRIGELGFDHVVPQPLHRGTVGDI